MQTIFLNQEAMVSMVVLISPQCDAAWASIICNNVSDEQLEMRNRFNWKMCRDTLLQAAIEDHSCEG